MGGTVLGGATLASGAIGRDPVGSIRLEPSLVIQAVRASLDAITVFAAAELAYQLYLWSHLGQQHFAPMFYFKLDLLLTLITVLALHGMGGYSGQMGLMRVDDVRRVIAAVSTGLVLLLAISFMWRLPNFSRLTGLLLWPIIVTALVAQRYAFWSVQRRVPVLHRSARPVIIYGAGETGRLLARCLLEEQHLGLRPAAFVDDNEALRSKTIKIGPGVSGERLTVLGNDGDLLDVLKRTGARIVFLAMPSAPMERVEELVGTLERLGVVFYVVPNAGEIMFSGLQFGHVAGMPVYSRRRPAGNRVYAAVRRATDVTVAACVLFVSLPALAFGAIAIKLASPGPVLFSQERIGLGGRRFRIYKLRTMHVDAPEYALHPSSSDDPRLFRVGRWLRRLSIDELPQLWNVVCGEMSLVGPRPEMPFIVDRYTETQRQRLSVTPGLTGLWQISADRAFCIHDNVHYDLYYVENRSLSMDLAILVMTPFALLARNRAM